MNPLRTLTGPATSFERQTAPIAGDRPHFDDLLDRLIDNASSSTDERRLQDEPRLAARPNEDRNAPPTERVDVTSPMATAPPFAPLAPTPRPARQATPASTKRPDGMSTTTTTAAQTTAGSAPVDTTPGPGAGTARLGEALQQVVTGEGSRDRSPIDARRLRGRVAKTTTSAGASPVAPPVAPRIAPLAPPLTRALMLNAAEASVGSALFSTAIDARAPGATASITDPGRDAMVVVLAPLGPAMDTASGIDDDDDVAIEAAIATVGGAAPPAFDGALRDARPVHYGATPPAALEQLEALLHDPATGILLDGRAAVVTVDGLKVRIVTDSHGHASVRMVAQDAALGATLEHQMANLSAALERAGLHVDQVQVAGGESAADGHHDRQHDGDRRQQRDQRSDSADGGERLRPSRQASPTATTTAPTATGAVVVRA